MRLVRITLPPLGFASAFLLHGEKTVLVDTGFPGSADRILQVLSGQGIQASDVTLILLAHGHHDHFGNASQLKEKLGAPVGIHEADADALREGRNPPVQACTGPGRFLMPFAGGGEAEGCEPEVLIQGGESLARFGIRGRVLHTPGHTPGSISVILDSGEAVVGDLIFGGLIRRRKPSLPWFCQDRNQVRESIRRLMAWGPEMIYASHGGPFRPDEILEIAEKEHFQK